MYNNVEIPVYAAFTIGVSNNVKLSPIGYLFYKERNYFVLKIFMSFSLVKVGCFYEKNSDWNF
jgi:hypothetical protein